MSYRPRLLLIDNFDSFTYNLWDYFQRLGVSCDVLRNDQLGQWDGRSLPYDGLVLSPGPGRPEEAGGLMPFIRRFSKELPMLGICLGHQALGLLFGASLERAHAPMHGKTSMLRHQGHPLFAGLPPRFSVMRYHSLILEKLPDEHLLPIAWTETGEVMALAHRQLPLTGIQFHPESILTTHGLEMLGNWLCHTFPGYSLPKSRMVAHTVPRL